MKFTSTQTVVTKTEYEFAPRFLVLENGNAYSAFQFEYDAQRFVEKMRDVESVYDSFEIVTLDDGANGETPLDKWERELSGAGRTPDNSVERCDCSYCAESWEQGDASH